MNLKKRLQKEAEKDAEVLLTEEDELFIKQLAHSNVSLKMVQPELKKSKKFWAVLGSVATVIIAAVIVFPSVFVNRGGNDIFYKDTDIVEVFCSLDEMQPNVKYFQIEEHDIPYTILLSYDSVSNDRLYYTVNGSTLISRFKLYLIINEHYDYNFTLNEDLMIYNLSNYNINYDKTRINGIDGAEVNYTGYVKLQTEIIYIEYQQLIDIGDQAFFDDIESIIKVKN